jgi:16S rRNA (guanine966-N2)-methyltransferase
MKNKLRIIAGNWRSRQIIFDNIEGLRPTPARVRETLFNWLQDDIIGSRCLDLYAGSGVLSFEAASRGAKQVVQVEQNLKVCRQLRTNAVNLNATQVNLIQSDVLRFLSSDSQIFNLAFIDPPFHKNLAIQSCQWLEDKGWLAIGAKINLEVEHKLSLTGIPENWQLLKAKSAGEVDYYLFQPA